jgi:hypothetical protein
MGRAACAHGQRATRHAPLDRHGRRRLHHGVKERPWPSLSKLSRDRLHPPRFGGRWSSSRSAKGGLAGQHPGNGHRRGDQRCVRSRHRRVGPHLRHLGQGRWVEHKADATASGALQAGSEGMGIGEGSAGLRPVRRSDRPDPNLRPVVRPDAWLTATWRNLSTPTTFLSSGAEETEGGGGAPPALRWLIISLPSSPEVHSHIPTVTSRFVFRAAWERRHGQRWSADPLGMLRPEMGAAVVMSLVPEELIGWRVQLIADVRSPVA